MNAVLERKRAEKASQIAFVDELLAKVEADGGRDLVEAETKNLEAARQRVRELDDQIEPLEEYEAMRDRHQVQAGAIALATSRQADGGLPGVRLAEGRRESVYGSPGAFVVDLIRARGLLRDPRGQALPPDSQAASRVQYALQNQTTTDTPGLLPHAIVGQVVNLIDATRPFITSIGGARPMGGIPGKTFGRPRITQHTLVGLQAAEKTELPTQKMVIGEVAFTKSTYGGAVDVSRQDIDWSSPAAWDILIRDLADVYAQATENVTADDMLAKADDVNAVTPVAASTIAAWSAALYTAAALVYASSKKLPDRIWCSVDVWAELGPITDLTNPAGIAGTSNLSDFGGNLFRIPRIVVPSWPANSCVVGSSGAYEVYEEVVGLLTAVEPSLLGVQVAYGGYVAYNAVTPEGLAQITPPA